MSGQVTYTSIRELNAHNLSSQNNSYEIQNHIHRSINQDPTTTVQILSIWKLDIDQPD